MLQRWHKANAGRSAIAGLLLTLFVFTLCLSSSEALHHPLHEDSRESDHQCAVALLELGLVEAADVTIPTSVPAVVPIYNVFSQGSFTSSIAALLPPGRAPPANA